MNERLVELLGSEWAEFLLDEYVENLLLSIGSRVSSDRKEHKVYPSDADGIFEVFRKLSPYDVKVVIIGQDPYPDGSYHGRAFSNAENTPRISPSLKNILTEVENDIYNGLHLEKNPDLTRWEDQGVFLINRVLTVRAGSAGSHSHFNWQEFTEEVITQLNRKRKNIVFMMWGNKAKAAAPIIDDENHLLLMSGHPSPLSANQGLWFGNKHFSKANNYLRDNKIEEIKW